MPKPDPRLDPFNKPPVLLDQGVSARSIQTVEQRLTNCQAAFNKADSLRDLSGEWKFFTPALVQMFTPFPQNLFDYYAEEFNVDVAITRFEFQTQQFGGLVQRPEYNCSRIIYAIEAEQADRFKEWMGTLGILDESVGVMYRVRHQEVIILDPLYYSKHPFNSAGCQLVTVPVTCYAVETSNGSFYWKDDSTLFPQAEFNKDVKWDSTGVFYQAMIAGCSDPYAAVNELEDKDAMSTDTPDHDGGGDRTAGCEGECDKDGDSCCDQS